jgi:hypothetical protein
MTKVEGKTEQKYARNNRACISKAAMPGTDQTYTYDLMVNMVTGEKYFQYAKG